MNHLGCIGHLMKKKTRLSDVLQDVYGHNTMLNMVSENPLTRATRGHFLMDAALNKLRLADVWDHYILCIPLFNCEISLEKEKESKTDTYTKIPGRDSNIAESSISTTKEICVQLTSSPDGMVDEESIENSYGNSWLAGTEKEKNW